MIRGVFILMACFLVHGSAFAELDHIEGSVAPFGNKNQWDDRGSWRRPTDYRPVDKKKQNLSPAALDLYYTFKELARKPEGMVRQLAWAGAQKWLGSLPEAQVSAAFSTAITEASKYLVSVNSGTTVQALRNLHFKKFELKQPTTRAARGGGSMAVDLLGGVARGIKNIQIKEPNVRKIKTFPNGR